MVVNVNDEMLRVRTEGSRRAVHCMVSNTISGGLVLVFLGSFHVCFERV